MSFLGRLFRPKPKLLSASLTMIDEMVKSHPNGRDFHRLVRKEQTFVQEVIRLQLSLGLGLTRRAQYPALRDRWVVGYIVGFCEERWSDFIQVRQGRLAVVVCVLCSLFGPEAGCAIAGEALLGQAEQDQDFNDGRQAGIADCISNAKERRVPSKLSKWLLDRESQRLEALLGIAPSDGGRAAVPASGAQPQRGDTDSPRATTSNVSAQRLERIVTLQKAFSEVDDSSVEEWIENISREGNPENELALFEKMAEVYTQYCSKKNLSLDAKHDVFKTALIRISSANNEQALELISTKLKALSLEGAEEVLKLF